MLAVSRAAEMELMTYLFGEYQEQESREQDRIMENPNLESESDTFWIKQAIPRIGLSPAILLKLVLSMDPQNKYEDDYKEVIDFYTLGYYNFTLKKHQDRLRAVAELDDNELVDLFVSAYLSRSLLARKENPVGDFLLEIAKKISRDSILKRLRQSMIILPQDDQNNSRTHSLRGSFVNLFETLTQPLDSESLRAFKMKWKQRSRSILSFGAPRRYSDEESLSRLSNGMESLRVSGQFGA
jgi:hypothetical protein